MYDCSISSTAHSLGLGREYLYVVLPSFTQMAQITQTYQLLLLAAKVFHRTYTRSEFWFKCIPGIVLLSGSLAHTKQTDKI